MEDELNIPDFLKISQVDRAASWKGRIAPTPDRSDMVAKQTERMDQRKRRKLRAESKKMQAEIDLIAGRNPKVTDEIQAKLDLVNRELYLVS